MGVSACPGCTGINNHRRTVCRFCGYRLKPYATPPTETRGTGRITFELEAARMVEYPGMDHVARSCFIPVLFDGKDVGAHVCVLLYPETIPEKGHSLPTSQQLKQFGELTEVVLGALKPRPRTRKV